MRVWLAAILALLVSAVPAHAGGTLIADQGAARHGGPVFAGDRLVWAAPSQTPEGYAVHAAAPDGSGHGVRYVEAPLFDASFMSFAFDASARRTGLSLQLNRYPCRKGCIAEIVYSLVSSGPLGAPLEPYATPCSQDFPGAASVSVDGDVVAAAVDCGRSALVRDFGAGSGEQRELAVPGTASRLRLAGPYLARYDGQDIVASEWRTGAERLRVAGSPYFDLLPDGTLAFLARDGDRARVMTASAAAPQPRVVAEDAGGEVRIAGDRVAYERAGGGIAVRRLDGSLVAESPAAGLTDFDGARVAWTDRSCARSAIATWDLQGAAPGLPRASPCPIATLRSSTLRANSTAFGPATVRVKLTCAAEPAVGCLGDVTLFAKDARPKYDGRLVDMTRGGFRLLPGESTTLELTYLKNRVCIARENGRRPIVELTGPAPAGSMTARVKRRRVRVVGLENHIRHCSA